MDNLSDSDMIEKHQTHESIVLIHSKISFACEFHFSTTSPEIFAKYIDKLLNNKAVGHNSLKATFIKLSGAQLSNSLCNFLTYHGIILSVRYETCRDKPHF